MATVGLYGSVPNAESVGLYGNNNVFAGTYFEWFIFQVGDTQPTTPTGGSWDFTTNTGTPPTGWLATPPVNPTNTVWVSIGLVNSRSSVAIVWSVPGKFSFASGLPILSGTGSPSSGLGVTDQLYIQTDTTPETIWFKQVGTWTRMTGSTLYADLTSNQTLAGTKTFSSPIAGSVTGTSANITGIAAIANGGTGTTTANGAFNALAPSQTGNSGKFLTTDGSNSSWSTNPLGTVTSVAISGGTTGLTTSGGPITTSGTITLAGTLAVANGGTGVTTSTGSGNTVLSTSPLLVTPTLSGAVVGNSAPYLNFNSTTAPAYNSGRFWYDSTQDSLAFNNVVTNNTIHLGQEVQLRVLNSTGSTIAAGNVVYVTPTASGQVYPNVALAKADALATAVVMGMANQAIPTGTVGYVTTAGVVAGLSTGTYAVGDVLYLSPYSAGQIMNTLPPTGYPVKVGVVSYANSPNGQIYIKQANSFVQAANVVGTLAIANGGTGQTTANAAFNALAPSQTSQSGKYLTTDGTNTSWATNPLGTVTSVAATVPSFLSITGSPITTSGTLAFGLSGTALPTTSGGTNLTSFTANGVVYASSTSALATGSALTFDGTNLAVGSASVIGGGRIGAIADLTAVNGLVLRDSATTYANNDNYILFQNSTAVTAGGLTHPAANSLGVWGNDDIRFLQSTAATEQMRLTSTGLGIGTSSPAEKLTVNGNIRISGGYALYLYNATNDGLGIWYNPAGAGVSQLTARVNGADRLTIDSAGNLGLGVTPSTGWSAPAKAFQISGTGSIAGYGSNEIDVSTNIYYSGGYKYLTAAAAASYQQNAGQHQWFNAPSGTAGNPISFTQAMTLDAIGNLGIGTTSPSSATNYHALTINGSSGSFIDLQTAGSTQFEIFSNTGGTTLAVVSASPLIFSTSNTERARINSSGNLLVGTTSVFGNAKVTVSSSATDGIASTQGTAGGYCFVANALSNGGTYYLHAFTANGTATGSITSNGTTTTYAITSDQRLKENIQDAAPASSLIDSLQVRQYDWKSDGSHQRYGFIAQELVTVAPEAVHQPEDPEAMMAVDYSKLVPMLVKEIQSLRKRLAAANI